MVIKYAGLTDVGKVRELNEDNFILKKINDHEFIFIVADGMGGHKAGEIASYKAVNSFTRLLIQEKKESNIIKLLKDIAYRVNKEIVVEGEQYPDKTGMGTTLSALYIMRKSAFVVHVGDSRIYRSNNSGLRQITEDHSIVNKMLKSGEITEREVKRHPRRHEITQSLGVFHELEIDTIGPIRLNEGEMFLLCTDGLTDILEDPVIKRELGKGVSPEKMCKNMIERARDLGAPDNVTVIVVRIDDLNPSSDSSTYHYVMN
jgi:protein phosphatase